VSDNPHGNKYSPLNTKVVLKPPLNSLDCADDKFGTNNGTCKKNKKITTKKKEIKLPIQRL
jgi:hypothetical protein